jgi:hypothetical protein
MRRKRQIPRSSYMDQVNLRRLVDAAKFLRKNPLSRSELGSKLGIKSTNKSLDRIISCLEAMGVIRKEDDKYEWSEDWQVFLDGEGYMYKLKHSEDLLKPLIEGSSSIGEWICNKYLVQHLKSKYPEIYSKYKDWKRKEKSCKSSREKFRDEVRKQAAKYGFEIVPYEELEAGRKEVSHFIYEDVESYIRRKDLENMRIVWKEGWVWDDYRRLALAREEGLIGEVKELIYGLVRSENVENALREVDIAVKQWSEAYSNYKKDIEWLALKVKHGEPLKGYCDLCPRVVIKHN